MRVNCIHRGRGTQDGKWTYEPDSSITKAEVMKTMAKIMGIAYQDLTTPGDDKQYTGVTMFQDIPHEHWAAWYATYAYQKNILTKLYTRDVDGLRYFSPDENITRADAVRMMVAVYEKLYGAIEVPVDHTMKMVDITSSDADYEIAHKASYINIIQGRLRNDQRYFDGNKTITRQEFAKIVYLPFQERFAVDKGQKVTAMEENTQS